MGESAPSAKEGLAELVLLMAEPLVVDADFSGVCLSGCARFEAE
jgi:hypothetical protein